MKLKFFAIICAVLLISSCAKNREINKFFQLNFYEEEIIPATTYLERGEVAAIEFYAAEQFSGIEVLAAKVADDDTLTVTLYEFNTDYATTLKSGKKVESATFRDYESRDTLLLSFRSVNAGKYLLTFSTKNSAGICVAAYPSAEADGNVKFYLNGEDYTSGAYYSAVIFNGIRLDKDYFKQEVVPVEPTPEEPENEPENSEEPTEIPEEDPTELPEDEPETVN